MASQSRKRLYYTPAVDIILLMEVVARNPYRSKTAWSEIASLLRRRPDFTEVETKSIKDRVTLLVTKFRKDDMVNMKKSGTEEQYTERDQLLQEVSDLEREWNCQVQAKGKGRRNAVDAEMTRAKAARLASRLPLLLPESSTSAWTQPSTSSGTSLSQPSTSSGTSLSQPSTSLGPALSQPSTSLGPALSQPSTSLGPALSQPSTSLGPALSQPSTSLGPALSQLSTSSARSVPQPSTSSAPPMAQPSTSSARSVPQPSTSSAPPLAQPSTSSARSVPQPFISSAPPLAQPSTTYAPTSPQSSTSSAPPLAQTSISRGPPQTDGEDQNSTDLATPVPTAATQEDRMIQRHGGTGQNGGTGTRNKTSMVLEYLNQKRDSVGDEMRLRVKELGVRKKEIELQEREMAHRHEMEIERLKFDMEEKAKSIENDYKIREDLRDLLGQQMVFMKNVMDALQKK